MPYGAGTPIFGKKRQRPMKVRLLRSYSLNGRTMTIRCCLVGLLMAVILLGSARAEPWRPAHVVVVIEENHAYEQIIGNPDAAFINELAAGGALFTNSHGVLRPRQPNYLALFSGSTQSVTNDRRILGAPLTGPN